MVRCIVVELTITRTYHHLVMVQTLILLTHSKG
ncbi:hypothetical protein [Salmonella phage SD-1_S14]|nr:hypothetical protein [Salmonella phage SD-1_S14]